MKPRSREAAKLRSYEELFRAEVLLSRSIRHLLNRGDQDFAVSDAIYLLHLKWVDAQTEFTQKKRASRLRGSAASRLRS